MQQDQHQQGSLHGELSKLFAPLDMRFCIRGSVVAGRAHAAEPHIGTAPRPLRGAISRSHHLPNLLFRQPLS
ncbi:hypothetical protein, partial [Streptomyces sp. PSKA30]|uniref:hypothetical protein n=1 Tax=Streptomyces sp. PSKA30 TaxID=2874597 RepID=UPI001CD132F5